LWVTTVKKNVPPSILALRYSMKYLTTAHKLHVTFLNLSVKRRFFCVLYGIDRI
jgi:hypothetical protein